jgi:dihydroorotate dehydrogenase (fumarate)
MVALLPSLCILSSRSRSRKTCSVQGAYIDTYESSFSEAVSDIPEVDLLAQGVDSYLDQLQRVKEAVDVPVIASLNGVREGEWVNYATLMEEAGADALELNLYFLPSDLDEDAAELESRCIRIVESIKARISLPLSVKLSPYFTALPQFAERLVDAGANGFVCFNRFYQPDIDVDRLEICPKPDLSDSHELRLRLRWLALLSGRIKAQLAVSGGVHTGLDMVKSLLVGADTIQIVSTLLQNGPRRIDAMLSELKNWMEEKGYASLDQLRGSYELPASPGIRRRLSAPTTCVSLETGSFRSPASSRPLDGNLE